MSEKSAADWAKSLAQLAEALERSRTMLDHIGSGIEESERASLLRSIAECERELRSLRHANRELSLPAIPPFWRNPLPPETR